ncbi:MAG: Si-specific NAD(P)(+) transhydrogenase [Phycisphaerae bacterium]|nr:Si-specific NAD(P)(+) transhydrogenase [Phycisphaerae bacterium]
MDHAHISAAHAGRYDLVCIGSGPAGEKAAMMAASVGKRVLIVERESMPGGAMVNTGTIASKVLRETALLCSAFRRRPMPGIEFSLDRTVSFRRFLARKTLVQLEEHDRIERSIDRHGIDVLRGTARFAGEHCVEVTKPDHSTCVVKSDFVLIATGSRPHRPGNVDFNHPAIVDCEGILQLDAMPASLIVVGGGVIGTEYACIFAEMGVPVTIIEPRDALMPFLDSEIRDVMTSRMRGLNIELVFNAAPDAAFGQADGSGAVRLKDGREFAATNVLWSLGRVGNTDVLDLPTIGLEADSRGLVKVNATYRTSVPWVFAAGDVIGFPALASTSLEQGRIAACTMFELPYKERLAATVPIGIYTIPAVAAVGLNEQEARAKGIDVVVGRARYRNNPRGRMLGDDQGLCKLVFDAADRRLIGASIVGEDATEQIHVAQTAMAFNGCIDFFLEMCFNYPSLGELFKYAAIDAAATLAARTTAVAA